VKIPIPFAEAYLPNLANGNAAYDPHLTGIQAPIISWVNKKNIVQILKLII